MNFCLFVFNRMMATWENFCGYCVNIIMIICSDCLDQLIVTVWMKCSLFLWICFCSSSPQCQQPLELCLLFLDFLNGGQRPTASPHSHLVKRRNPKPWIRFHFQTFIVYLRTEHFMYNCKVLYNFKLNSYFLFIIRQLDFETIQHIHFISHDILPNTFLKIIFYQDIF